MNLLKHRGIFPETNFIYKKVNFILVCLEGISFFVLFCAALSASV